MDFTRVRSPGLGAMATGAAMAQVMSKTKLIVRVKRMLKFIVMVVRGVS